MATRLWVTDTNQGTRIRPDVAILDNSDVYTLNQIQSVNSYSLHTSAATLGPYIYIYPPLGPVAAPGIGFDYDWTSTPVTSQVTISGQMYFSFNACEYAANTNATIRVIVWSITPAGTVNKIIDSLYGTEVGTTRNTSVAVSWYGTPTTTTLNPGDIVVARAYVEDANGVTLGVYRDYVYLGYGGYSFFDFAETVSFGTNTPSGTTTRFLNDNSDLSGKKKIWTDASDNTSVSYTITTTAGSALDQLSTEWITPSLSEVTVSGAFLFNYVGTSTPSYYNAILAYIYKTDSDGSNPVRIGQGRMNGGFSSNGIIAYTIRGHVNGTVAYGERLLVRLFGCQSTAAKVAGTVVLTAERSGAASYIQWPATLTAFTGNVAAIPATVIEVTSAVEGDTFEQASYMTAATAAMDAYVEASFAVTTNAIQANASLTCAATITGGNATASLSAGVTLLEPTLESFSSTPKVLANFGAYGTPDYTTYPETGYPEYVDFAEIPRVYSDLLDVTNKDQWYINNTGGKNYGAEGPVIVAAISPNRFIAVWPQNDQGSYDVDTKYKIDYKIHAVLVDASNSREPKIIDRVAIAQNTPIDYVATPNGGSAPYLRLPNNDIVTIFGISDAPATPDNGLGDSPAPMQCWRVDGDNLSCVWSKQTGGFDPTYADHWTPCLTYYNGYIYLISEHRKYSGGYQYWSGIAKIDPDTGVWVSYNTNQNYSGNALYHIAFPSGNYYVLGGPVYTSPTWKRGSLDGMTLEGTWNAFNTDINFGMGELCFPRREKDGESWVIITNRPSDTYDYWWAFRLKEVNGSLVAEPAYGSDEIMTPSSSSHPPYPDYYTYPDGWHNIDQQWNADPDAIFAIPHGDGRVSIAGQGSVLYQTMHCQGIQISYDVGAEQDLGGDRYNLGVSKRWDSPPSLINNWKEYMWVDADGQAADWRLSFDYMGNGKICIGLGSTWYGELEERILVAVYNAGSIPPPLKLSQRDDDKVAGAARIGYDSENSGDIRAGRVAW